MVTPELHVEGKDDLHTIAALLQRHGVDMGQGKRPFTIVEAEDVDRLMAKIPVAVLAATDRPVGFVLDTDIPITRRWTQVHDRLRECNVVDPPSCCPPQGFIGRRRGYPNPVGVWLMPDCTSDGGKLEHLLTTLIPKADGIWPHAQKSTAESLTLGAQFSEQDRINAEVHCWLAWQKEPGKPFGTAINAKFLNHDSPQALAFLIWLKSLFGFEVPLP